MVFEVDIHLNEELRQQLDAEPLPTVTADFEIRSDGDSLFDDIASRGVWNDFVHLFLLATLESVLGLADGESYQHALEGPFAVRFEPTDAWIEVFLVGKPSASDVLSGTRFHVDFEAFVAELADAAEEFTAFALEEDESLENRESMRELQAAIREAKTYIDG